MSPRLSAMSRFCVQDFELGQLSYFELQLERPFAQDWRRVAADAN
jgi:hypothetical protein